MYTLIFAPEIIDHFTTIERKYHGLIRQVISEQLRYIPSTETTNRKPLSQPAILGATWEIRCGPNNRFRVFYQVNEMDKSVFVLAIGVKDRNRVLISGQEMTL